MSAKCDINFAEYWVRPKNDVTPNAFCAAFASLNSVTFSSLGEIPAVLKHAHKKSTLEVKIDTCLDLK